MTTVWVYVDTSKELATATISRCLQLKMPPMNGSRRTIPRELLLDMRSRVTKPGRDPIARAAVC